MQVTRTSVQHVMTRDFQLQYCVVELNPPQRNFTYCKVYIGERKDLTVGESYPLIVLLHDKCYTCCSHLPLKDWISWGAF